MLVLKDLNKVVLKKYCIRIGLIFISLLLCQSALPYRSSSEVEDQVIIKIESVIPINEVIAEFQGEAIDSVVFQNIFLTEFADPQAIDNIITALGNIPEVIYVQRNYLIGLPETFQISQQFPDTDCPRLLDGESPPQYFSDAGAYSIKIDSANILASGENIVVAVIDNGVEFEHPLFNNSFVSTGYDLIDKDDYAAEVSGSVYGHGTFVSGIIKRVAPDCKLLPIRAFDGDGQSNSFDITKAIQLAINDSFGVDVINMSFGMYTSNPAIEDAISTANNLNIAIVAAPGNDNTVMTSYPAAYSGVIAVSAIDNFDIRAGFSNYGEYIDVCAPGVDVYSSLAGEYEWGTWSGTSFSAPMATGICALMKELEPDLTSIEIEEIIRLAADKELQWGIVSPPDIEYGSGRINAFKTLFLLKRGDVDDNGDLNILDIIYLIDFIYKSGPSPILLSDLGDFDCSGYIDILDVVAIINHLYKNELQPSCF